MFIKEIGNNKKFNKNIDSIKISICGTVYTITELSLYLRITSGENTSLKIDPISRNCIDVISDGVDEEWED